MARDQNHRPDTLWVLLFQDVEHVRARLLRQPHVRDDAAGQAHRLRVVLEVKKEVLCALVMSARVVQGGQQAHDALGKRNIVLDQLNGVLAEWHVLKSQLSWSCW